jgi:predicted transcriptional regulator
MKNYGIARRNIAEATSIAERKRVVPSVTYEVLSQLYVNENMSTREIARRLGIGKTTVSRWLKRYEIPVRKCKNPKYPRKSFSNDGIEKAYMLGLRAGDIHARNICRTVAVSTGSTHPAMVNLFYKIYSKYGHCNKISCKIKSRNSYCWMVYCYLDKSFDFLIRKPLRLPKRNDLFYSFLAGYADAEGSWVIQGKNERTYFTFEIGSRDSGLLRQIKENLEENGYHPSFTLIIKENNVNFPIDVAEKFCVLSLTRREEVISLAKRILKYSQHEEKLAKIKLVLKVKDKKRWSEVKDGVEELRKQIKNDVKECIKQAEEDHKRRHKGLSYPKSSPKPHQ